MAEQPKYLFVADTLRKEIADGIFQDGDKLMTEEALRDRFNVSRQTIRQAISLLEDDGLVDRQRGSGTYVRHGSRKHQGVIRVGVITTYITDYIFPAIVSGLESVLSKTGGVMTLSATYNSPEAEKRILERVMDGQVDGLIVEGVRTARATANEACFHRLAERNVPVLFMNGYYKDMKGDIPYVIMDDEEGGRMAARELLARGYTRPAGFFKSDDLQGRERAEGMMQEMNARGIQIPEERMLLFSTEHRMDILSTPEGKAFLDMLASGEADCVACYNDSFAIGLVERLTARGVKVPEEMGIISFDNSSLATMCHPQLTTLNHKKEEFGAMVARKMLRMIDGKKEKSIKVPWTLVERDSLPVKGSK